MNNVIKQLKKNEKPFGLMSEEMQEKANAMDKSNGQDFQVFQRGGWKNNHLNNGGYNPTLAYRLRPDYAEKPEIVECEIRKEGAIGDFIYKRTPTAERVSYLHHAGNKPDFIGFKFEDGLIRAAPLAYRRQDGHCDTTSHVSLVSLGMEADEVLHATHVLFRRQE